MTYNMTLTGALQDAARRVLDGNVGDRLIAGAVAIINVMLFHPASWLLVIAFFLTTLDWLAGRDAARRGLKTEPYSAPVARGGINSKMMSWAMLLIIWLLTMVFLSLGDALQVDLSLSWVVPIFFTSKFMLEEVHSIDENLGNPRWMKPLIEFLNGITTALAPRDKRRSSNQLPPPE